MNWYDSIILVIKSPVHKEPSMITINPIPIKDVFEYTSLYLGSDIPTIVIKLGINSANSFKKLYPFNTLSRISGFRLVV
jgi:hypothetical protein